MFSSRILWQRLDFPGHEICTLEAIDSGWALHGNAMFVYESKACDFEYSIRCDASWRTQSVLIRGDIGGHEKSIDIKCNEVAEWRVNDVQLPELSGCIDVDLGFSPSTNLLPIRRLTLAIGERANV